jgi:hypothetical protein
VSRDLFGDELFALSRAAGLDLRYTQRVAKSPLLAMVVSKDPPRYFFVGDDSADLDFDLGALPEGWMDAAEIVHFGCIGLIRQPHAWSRSPSASTRSEGYGRRSRRWVGSLRWSRASGCLKCLEGDPTAEGSAMNRASLLVLLIFAGSCDDPKRAKPDGGTSSSADAGNLALADGTYSAGAVWGPVSSGHQYQGGLWGGQTLTFDPSGSLAKLTNASWQLETSEAPAEFGADGVVAWGRWASGTSTNWGGRSGTAPMIAMNYISGAQSPSQGVLHATYSAFASTAPTAISGASLAVGSSNAVAGTVSIGNGTAALELHNITVGGHTYSLTASAGFYATTGVLAGGTVTSDDGGCPCTAQVMNAGAVQGWFFGANGERAGFNYGFSSAVGDVSGAVVFK